MHVAAACSIVLAIHMQSGAHVVEHSAYDDRVAWVLPPDRLAAFARSGVVINEEKKTRITAIATVANTLRGMFTIDGTLDKTSEDVPRHRAEHSIEKITATLTERNDPFPAQRLDVEEAAVTDLPDGKACVGQKWRTHIPVMSTLGSGTATFDHTIVKNNGRLIRIDVTGAGVISGMEYNLPRLLPGHIEIAGSAWFDPVSGVFTQETYVLHNTLIRTVRGKTIGFRETETVEITTHVVATDATRSARGTTP